MELPCQALRKPFQFYSQDLGKGWKPRLCDDLTEKWLITNTSGLGCTKFLFTFGFLISWLVWVQEGMHFSGVMFHHRVYKYYKWDKDKMSIFTRVQESEFP